MSFIKTNFHYKEKSGIVTKVKLRTFKKNNQLYFGTWILASLYHCGDSA